ncbi:2-C-methyl-D-erythritol 2,4-cyclodiphosphate synthase, partial [Vibrio parahaemolyticus]
LGFVGRKEGIACAAVVLLVKDNSNESNECSVPAW